ncbi:MAG TPA: protease pro-enzyme activation domain-containing protein [Terracidiphilus sp.]|nr:protease pro-enzyme activation domain-containing protein [Terracidiphilus sp.]
MIPRTGKLLTFCAALTLSATCLAQSVMTHHVRDVVKGGHAQANGRLPGNQVLDLDLVLPVRNPAGLKAFLADVYNPASPNYRQFLTPTEFTARFGPTADDYDTVVRFAKTYGFDVVGGSRDGMLVQVKGTVSNIEAAFHVNMRTYKHPTEDRNFFSTDSEPALDLPFKLWHISGLDNYSIPRPLVVNKKDYAAAHGIQPEQVVSLATTGSGPSASFLGSDMRAAYATGTALTGAGQNLGLFEFEGTNLADLTTYFKNVGQTNNVPVTLVSTDGTSTGCSAPRCDDTEQTLDMTQALGMAPGLASLVVYIGSTDTSIISAMTTHNPLPTTIGCSWGWTPADPSTLDPFFQKMASQGQNFFAASGDSSTWSKRNEAWPADDANVVSVGGTDLVTASAGGAWASETAWVDSGGGISPDGIAIPSWQTAAINSSNKGSTTLRNGPDVSANANFTFYVCADQTTCTANEYGGTSFAAPMWAGFIALVNQNLANNSKSPIGFINPTIYSQNANSSTYSADFHDIKSGTSGSFSAVTGFDLVTGWGSPTAALITALSGTIAPGFGVSASPSTVSVAQTGAQGTTVTITPNNGFTGSVALTTSTLPTGVTIGWSTNPVPITSSSAVGSTLTFTTSGAAPGSYPITVTATSGGIVETTIVTLTVTGATPTFTLTPSATKISVSPSGTGKITLTTAISGGFSSAVSLSGTVTGSRVTLSFSPLSIAAPGAGTSTMTITVNRRAAAGTRTITITGTGGGVTQHATVTLTIP